MFRYLDVVGTTRQCRIRVSYNTSKYIRFSGFSAFFLFSRIVSIRGRGQEISAKRRFDPDDGVG